MGYLTIKLQNSTWYKCLNLSLTGSCTYVCTYVCTYIHTFVQKDVHSHTRTHVRKTQKLYALSIIQCGGIKTLTFVDTDADANANANADAKGSTIALRESCSGELIKMKMSATFVISAFMVFNKGKVKSPKISYKYTFIGQIEKIS